MTSHRNHPKPELVDPFDLPAEPEGDADEPRALAAARAPATIEGDVDAGDRVERRSWRRPSREKRRHATG